MFGRVLRSRNVANSLWIIGEQIAQMLISLILGVLTARYLGPSHYGELNYTASFVAFGTSIASLGMEGVIIKKMIKEPDMEGEYLGSCIVFRLISSILCSLMIAIVVYVLNPNEPIKVTLVLLQSIQLVFQAVYILDSWFQRHLKSKYISIAKLVACMAVAGYRVFLLATGKSIEWFAFTNSLTYVIVAVVAYAFYIHQGKQRLKVSILKGREVLSESYHFILSGIMTSIYGQISKIMIGKLLTDTDVGLYSVATGICGMWIFVPMAIINSFRPTIMVLKQAGREQEYRLRLEQLYSVIIWLCICVSVMICLIAPTLIKLLYGQAYLGAVGSLRIVIWMEIFSMIGVARGIWVLCEDKNKYVKYYLAIGAIVSIVLNLWCVPKLGIEGAALSTLVTQIITSIMAPLCFKATRAHTGIVLRALVCSWFFMRKKGGKMI